MDSPAGAAHAGAPDRDENRRDYDGVAVLHMRVERVRLGSKFCANTARSIDALVPVFRGKLASPEFVFMPVFRGKLRRASIYICRSEA